jgi:hypothetical protein
MMGRVVDDRTRARVLEKDVAASDSAGGIGCSLVVLHDRLFLLGGHSEAEGFRKSVYRWNGTFDRDLATVAFGRDESGYDGERVRRQEGGALCLGWRECAELELPEAMHAHSAFAMPLMLLS